MYILALVATNSLPSNYILYTAIPVGQAGSVHALPSPTKPILHAHSVSPSKTRHEASGLHGFEVASQEAPAVCNTNTRADDT